MQLSALYDAYVDTFRVEGELPLMMALKREHTSHVVENALAIASGEGFDPVTSRVCEAAALLHVVQKGWLSDWPEEERRAILCAVLYHNRRDLPEGLDALTLAASQTVRDADKLDIFRVMEDRVKNTDWRHDSLAFWNLPTTARPSSVVVDAIRHGQPVDYQNIVSLADFVLVQVGWMVSGLAYSTTRRLTAERGHLAFQKRSALSFNSRSHFYNIFVQNSVIQAGHYAVYY